jgi:hypothetical protein
MAKQDCVVTTANTDFANPSNRNVSNRLSANERAHVAWSTLLSVAICSMPVYHLDAEGSGLYIVHEQDVWNPCIMIEFDI